MKTMMRFAAFLCLLVPLVSKADGPAEAKPIDVPYRLTVTNHVLVRAKVNGKGPFNFILDTGAPALFMTKQVAEKAGVTAAKSGLSNVDRFEVEGGIVFEKTKGRVEDIFQIQGMNGMGLAGVELHGVIGYNLLAKYRIEYDFARDKLPWTPLSFQPRAISVSEGRAAAGGLEMIGTMMKFLGPLLGMKPNFALEQRGFVGAEFADRPTGGVYVTSVLPGSPADIAGLKVGDELLRFGNYEIEFLREVPKKLAKHAAGESLSTVVKRDGKEVALKIELGKGL